MGVENMFPLWALKITPTMGVEKYTHCGRWKVYPYGVLKLMLYRPLNKPNHQLLLNILAFETSVYPDCVVAAFRMDRVIYFLNLLLEQRVVCYSSDILGTPSSSNEKSLQTLKIKNPKN